MKSIHPPVQRFDNFDQLVNAASTVYTLSFKDACKALKCSRSWAQNYIKPFVPYIYLSNGKGTGGANYARLVSLLVNKQKGIDKYSNESLYLNEKAFNEYVFSSIVSCQKRSKRVHKSFFVHKHQLNDYYKQLLELYLRAISDKNNRSEIFDQMDKLYLRYAKNDYVKTIIAKSTVEQTKRTRAEFVDVPVPDVPISRWKAVHDLLDYGEIEETIYRDLFRKGHIRIEIKMPDKDGVIKSTGKVYYISDPNPVHSQVKISNIEEILSNYSSDKRADISVKLNALVESDYFNISQEAWIKYNNMLGNIITY